MLLSQRIHKKVFKGKEMMNNTWKPQQQTKKECNSGQAKSYNSIKSIKTLLAIVAKQKNDTTNPWLQYNLILDVSHFLAVSMAEERMGPQRPILNKSRPKLQHTKTCEECPATIHHKLPWRSRNVKRITLGYITRL